MLLLVGISPLHPILAAPNNDRLIFHHRISKTDGSKQAYAEERVIRYKLSTAHPLGLRRGNPKDIIFVGLANQGP
jgi:hypothetical protein